MEKCSLPTWATLNSLLLPQRCCRVTNLVDSVCTFLKIKVTPREQNYNLDRIKAANTSKLYHIKINLHVAKILTKNKYTIYVHMCLGIFSCVACWIISD